MAKTSVAAPAPVPVSDPAQRAPLTEAQKEAIRAVAGRRGKESLERLSEEIIRYREQLKLEEIAHQAFENDK